MEFLPMFPIILFAAVARCYCEPISIYNYNNGNGPLQFGDILKPPPPLQSIAPVPFYGGKLQRQIKDLGYHYQPAVTPPTVPTVPPSGFKFPAPFYKQYDFNFVPRPQPFTTTPSPSFFQKISGWLFSPRTSATSVNNVNIESLKKDCNPCNQVPWIPVIKYKLGDKNVQQSLSPTYGPPSPTALAQNIIQYRPQSFNYPNQEQIPNQHTIDNRDQYYSNSVFGTPVATYGPPNIIQQTSFSSQHPPSPAQALPSPSYGFPQITGLQSTSSLSYELPHISTSPKSYVTPLSAFSNNPQVTAASSKPQTYFPDTIQNQLPAESHFENSNVVSPANNKLPKVLHPFGFKNSYGEDISNSHGLDIPISFTSLGSESIKVTTQVPPQNIVTSFEPNVSVALANPAPFSLNRGRNIHTLQPVALPNLSVSPLPPIFNARPFRPIVSTTLPPSIIHGINYMKKTHSDVVVTQSVPIKEFVHSIEYPTTIIQSPVIDIDASKSTNQNKAYRNIPNSYVIDEVRDISPQASEDHISSAKVNQDFSFETTGAEVGSNSFDTNLPADMRQNSYTQRNHKPEFTDLRGVKDEDVDRYRTESNLQSIDSPLLYLKPSAPHKNFENFLFAFSRPLSTSTTHKEYEIYDEILTTTPPNHYTTTVKADSDRNNHGDLLSAPDGRENKAKIVQIIVPYITEQKLRSINKNLSLSTQEEHQTPTNEEYLGRKVPLNTEETHSNTFTEMTTVPSTTEGQLSTVPEYYDSELRNTPTVTNDFYDIREPPFDIIQLQHTIDDWTEQEYSNHYSTPDRTRVNEKYAKQIPDEFLTTIIPINQEQTTTIYNFDDFDHEGSSSIQHSVTETRNTTPSKSIQQYNTIDITKNKFVSEKGETDSDQSQKLRIYTAASSFRGTTTTPAPWGSIQTSISPLTKEKVYVVTSKPWRDKNMAKTETHQGVEKFEFKKLNNTKIENLTTDNFPFKSPRFSNRPSFGFTASGPMSLDSIKSDSSYGFSKGWHHSINNLRSLYQSDRSLSSESSDE